MLVTDDRCVFTLSGAIYKVYQYVGDEEMLRYD